MKYFEYVYLALAIMCLIFLATEYNNINTRTLIYVLIATGIFSFMYSFKRRQRIRYEDYVEEQMKKLEEELEDE
ncbi:MAG: hypothetical protein KDD63_06110 [Bacteroidetes bacterium]|nr:hypothetical protein [Bacteroidota bacterium]MCB0843182.1 hypothetical protein [Bacteroidota bacterium]MCB0851772.1 hypothetical protein [Bacteroidota bacterium]